MDWRPQDLPLPAPSQGHTSAPVSTVGRAPTFALTSLPTSLGGALRTMDRAGHTGPMAPLSTHLPEAGAQAQPASWLPRELGFPGRLLPPGKGPGAHRPWTQLRVSRGRGRTGLWALLPETNLEHTTFINHLGRHGAERRAGRLPCQSTCGKDYKGASRRGGLTKGAWAGRVCRNLPSQPS